MIYVTNLAKCCISIPLYYYSDLNYTQCHFQRVFLCFDPHCSSYCPLEDHQLPSAHLLSPFTKVGSTLTPSFLNLIPQLSRPLLSSAQQFTQALLQLLLRQDLQGPWYPLSSGCSLGCFSVLSQYYCFSNSLIQISSFKLGLDQKLS